MKLVTYLLIIPKVEEVYIIVPAYNEEESIATVLSKLTEKFKNVICVNDGSSDKTEQKIRESQAVLITHLTNLGQGAAIQTGVEYALQDHDAKYFVTFDADGQHTVSDIQKLLRTIKKERVNIVLGSRFLSGQTQHIPWLKRQLLRLAVAFSNISPGIKLTDAHNGMRIFDRSFAEKLNITFSDYSHASEIIYRIKEHGFSYTEESVTIRYNKHRKGQPIINSVNIVFDMLEHKLRKR